MTGQSFTHSSNNISTWPGPPKMLNCGQITIQTNGETQKRRNGARPVWRRILTTTLGGPGCSHDPPPPHPVPLYIFKAPNGVRVPDSHLRPFSSGNSGSGLELEDSGFSFAGSGFSPATIFFGKSGSGLELEDSGHPFSSGNLGSRTELEDTELSFAGSGCPPS